ncbi:Hypothetical predicted protein [Xyrichtys novacula]|uniref:Uncharacterized protein n=1 Tax=Xyrichtys novacula TaxID=13765 RepID=A0AAV1GMF9_XYRNO|nr:Hypothetical predicted protein [Xyrichtys novacula]
MQTVQTLTAVKPVTVTCLITCCECLSSDRTLLHRDDISRQGERVEFGRTCDVYRPAGDVIIPDIFDNCPDQGRFWLELWWWAPAQTM